MKIIPNSSHNTKKTSNKINNQKHSKKIPSQVFLTMIDDIADETILESIFSEPDFILNNISILAEELDKIGQELAEKPLPELFFRYKKHIRLLLKGVSKNIKIREITARVGLTRTKLFRTAEAIDQLLAELAQKILGDERNRIEILSLTNQLQGLVIDIIT